jgi:glycosyltransferase involved in cell wall biosynthesis
VCHLYPISIYVAKIEIRKAQYKYQTISSIDFVGNYHDSDFDITRSNYLGEWDKETLYKNLTEYGNLVLLSQGEADPLVVKEGLVAGLGVVLSESATANLDLSKPFITVIPNEKLENIQYVFQKIIENRLISIKMREEIRDYGLKYFSWNKIIDKYIQTCIVV